MRSLCIAVVCTWLSGCFYAAAALGGAMDVADVDPIKSSAEAQERRANDAANEEAERTRERENEAIRATGRRLDAERDRENARRAAELRGSNDVAIEPATLPPRITAAMVSAAVATVRTEALSCRTQSTSKGQVMVFVKVAPEGNVIAVTVQTTPDAALGRCVAAAIQKATLATTESGGSFRYPFEF